MACTWKVYDCVGEGLKWGLGEIGEGVTSGAVEVFAKAIGEAASEVLKSLNGVWLGVKAGETGGPINTIQGELNWLVGYVAVASLLMAAIRMALDRRGQSMKMAFMGMWKVLLAGAIAVPAAGALMRASDAYAEEVYAKSDLGGQAAEMLGVMTLGQPGLVLVFGLLVMLSTFVQIVLMYIRIGVMIMLIGTLPLAASASMTGWGEGWWKKHIGWLAAWLLYKPAAALIIFSATAMTQDARGTKDLTRTIAGMGMLILAVFALPALLKLIVPATAALGGTSGGTVTLNAVNNLASGAVAIAGGSVGGGGGGGTGGAGGSSAAPQGSPSAGAGAGGGGAGAGGGAGGAGGAAGGAGGAAGGAAAGAATGGVALAAQAAAVVAQTQIAAASEVVNSLDDNDGMKGHNQ
ncbi:MULTISPECIES: hypothetical protein [Streptomyces]|uniref:hypothetical protein n=1 Tax=Streptomyces TaxID=1883 RepID=UPI0004BDE97B|nr:MULTISPECIES: hypothetical protein [Streptomyces]KOT93279.1 membrane protein [Streptomyces sp. NRRL F-4711]KOX42403.1 membrane protein [Streptomyces sp. NRRL F-7442]NEB62435.1 hypothetical protein [Streptomyces diastaticus]